MILSSRSLGSDEDDEDSDKSLEDIDDYDTVEMIDTFDDIDDREDRDDRQLVFRRPLRPRFPVVLIGLPINLLNQRWSINICLQWTNNILLAYCQNQGTQV